MKNTIQKINSVQSEEIKNIENNIKTRVFARLVSNKIPQADLEKISGGEWHCYGTHNEKFIAMDCGN
jgi:hypothetical protein